MIEQNPALETVIRRRLEMARVDRVAQSSVKPLSEPLPKGLRRRARTTPPEVLAAKKVKNQAKVAAYRSRLPVRGLRTVKLWVLDTRDPEFAAEAGRQAQIIAAGYESNSGGDDHG
jgi:hypothetical protein